ncbi:MAG: hypothetical protein M1609_14465 [Firmicutes bacterium]|nr:hypothetical protein [Bacillota bacterium]
MTRTMTAEVKPPVLTGKAVWSNNGIDYPVEVTGYTGKFNGRQYVNVAGSKSAVPLDEIKLTNDVSPTLKPQSAAAPGFDLKPNLNGRSSGQANTVGLTVSPELKAYPELGLHGNPLKQATTTPLREVATARDVTLDSSIIPGLRQFVDEDVLPKSKSTVHGIRDTFNSIRGLLFPRSTISEPALNAVMRFKGLRDKELFVAERTMSGIKDMFNKMPQREQIEFLDRFKRGMAQKNPELQALADEYQRADDAMYSEIAKYKPSLTYKENHFRIFWKVVPGQQEAKGFEGLFRGPLQGTRGFMKQSTLQDVSEGIAKGGVPVSTNPQTLFELGQADAMRYVTAQRMWQELKGIDMVKFVKMGNRIPEGFTTLNDRIANVYFPVKEGLVNSGSWYVEKNVARLLNNYLSRDLIRETPVGRFFIGLKNLTTSIELSLSPFHFVFETIEAMGSKMGIGLTRMVNQGVLGLNPRQFAKGALEVLSTPFAPYNFAKTGGRAIKYISNPGEFIQTMGGRRFLNQFPEARQIIDDLFTGGGKLAMNEDYRINTLDTFKSNLHSGNFIGAALRAFPSLNEQVMKPLFEIYIPRLKIGLFFHEYGQQLEQHAEDLLSGKMSRERLAREVWDRTENKFGEMNFDNLFWNRTFKSALQLLFRSVTWKLGNIRGFGSAILGQGKNLLDMKNGRVPRLDPGMAWLMGMLTTTAAISTILQKALTGKDPQELKDFVYPQVGGTDKDGNPNRLSIPTYFRDAVSLTHSPVDYTKNSLSGMVSKLSDILQNKDFFGNYIYDPKDPAWKQFLDSVGYFTPKPFVLTQVQNLQKNNTTPAVQALGFAGFLKAPREIIQSKFQQELSKAYGDQIPDKSLTPVEQKKAQLKRDLKDKIFYGKITDTEAKDFALQNGLYTPKYVDQFIKDAKLPPMVYMWKQLGDAERAQILPLATPAEVTRLREYGVLERVKKPSVNSIGNSLVPKLPQLPKIKLPAVK